MKLDIFTYFGDYIGSILGWAFLLLLIIRVIISFRFYNSSMKELKQGIKAMALLVIALIYLISPIDIIPDVLVVIGWLDDILVTVGSIIYAREAASKIFWGDNEPRNRFLSFIMWYSGATVITGLIKYSIYLY